jgi:hypothetical protein
MSKGKAATAGGAPCHGKSGEAGTTTAAATSPCHGRTAASVASAKSCCGKGKGAGAVSRGRVAALPTVTYRVGEFETGCRKSAAGKAAETKEALTFLVGDKRYEREGEAKLALVSLLDERAAELTQVEYVVGDKAYHCSKTAAHVAKQAKAALRYRVAGVDFADIEQASAVAEKAKLAAGNVRMGYKADGKPVSCPSSCKGKKVTYVVGDGETDDEKSAKLMLAEHVIRTIVETVVGSAS